MDKTAAEVELIECPFCGESDFDKLGLKMHLQRGWCEAYNNLDLPMSANKEGE